MDDKSITLQEAITQVEEWLAEADRGCRNNHGIPTTEIYAIYVGKWNALKNVALLLSKIATKESE